MNDQNNYENKNKSLDPLRPLFKEGDSRFIYNASFKSKIFQLVELSIILTLLSTQLIREIL